MYSVELTPHYGKFITHMSILKNEILREEEENRLNPKFSNLNGKYVPHGNGRMLYSGISGAWIYEGIFRNGLKHQYGRWIWNDGTIYQGGIKNDQLHG